MPPWRSRTCCGRTFDGQYERTPYLRPALREAEHVWVGERGFTGGLPPPLAPLLSVGGSLLEENGEPVELEGMRFGVYRSAMARQIDVGVGHPASLRSCPERIRFTAPPAPATLYALRLVPGGEDIRVSFDGAALHGQDVDGSRLSGWVLPAGGRDVDVTLPGRDQAGRCHTARLYVLARE